MADSYLNTWNLLNSARQFCYDTTKNILSYIEEIEKIKELPDNKPIYAANLLDIVNPSEPNTSEMLRILFSYQKDNEFVIFRSFADRFLKQVGFDISRITKPTITAEKERIDIWAREDGLYSIVFENKLKGAVYQRNQLGRYIKRQELNGFKAEDVYVVLLPNHKDEKYIDSIPSSVWKCPIDFRATNYDRICGIEDNLCWCDNNEHLPESQASHCLQCQNYLSDYRSKTVVLENDFADWLLSITHEIDDREVVLISAINIFADYIKFLYGKRISNKLIMDITNFLKDELFVDINSSLERYQLVEEKINDANALIEALNKLKYRAARDLIDEWFSDLQKKWPTLKREPNKSLGLNINGVWVGCWSGDDNNGKPYWGFFAEDPTKEQIDMVNDILSTCGIDKKQSNNRWIAWYTTFHGIERCDTFFTAAKELGFLK